MSRATDSLERTGYPLEPKSRPARREDSEFSHRRYGQAGCRAQLSLRNDASRNRATCHLPFRANRHGIEHVQVAIPVAPTLAGSCAAGGVRSRSPDTCTKTVMDGAG